MQTRPSGLTRRQLLRYSVGAAAAGALPLSLAGCEHGQGADTDALTFIYMGTADQQAVWNKLFARFKQKHPGIDLKASAIPSDNWADFFNKVSTKIAGGDAPDMIQVATEGQRLFASKQLLEPLDPYIAKDKSTIDAYLADLDPNLVKWNKEHSSIGGKTYYLPGEFNPMCVWYNTKLFTKAGLDEPDPEWTWDDFRKACKQIKARTGQWAYNATGDYFVCVMPWLVTNGTSTFDDAWSKPTFDSPAAVEAAEFLRGLVVDKLSPPPGGTFDRDVAMSQDKLAMYGGGRWPIVALKANKADKKVAIVPWPKKVRQGSPIGWNGYPILKSSKHKDDAWTFIKFLISTEGVRYFAEIGGTIVPARRSVAESKSYLDASPPGTKYLYDALSYGTPIPAPDKGAQIQQVIEDTWKQILVGNVGAAKGLKQAQQKLAGLV